MRVANVMLAQGREALLVLRRDRAGHLLQLRLHVGVVVVLSEPRRQRDVRLRAGLQRERVHDAQGQLSREPALLSK